MGSSAGRRGFLTRFHMPSGAASGDMSGGGSGGLSLGKESRAPAASSEFMAEKTPAPVRLQRGSLDCPRNLGTGSVISESVRIC